jgi:glutathione S-transferase
MAVPCSPAGYARPAERGLPSKTAVRPGANHGRGRPALFETGAILLDVGVEERKATAHRRKRVRARDLLVAALNSIEPPFMNLAEVDFFIEDERKKAARRPDVVKAVNAKLVQLANALGSRSYLIADEFTIADMLTSSALNILQHTDLLEAHPSLVDYRDRCFARLAYQKAIADQCAAFAGHTQKDMKYELRKNSGVRSEQREAKPAG